MIGDLSAFTATSFSPLLTPEAVAGFTLSSIGAIDTLRTLTKASKLQVIPCHVSQVGPYIEQGLNGCDVAFVQLSQADENGQHRLGLIRDHPRAPVDKARVVLARVKDQNRFTFGEDRKRDG